MDLTHLVLVSGKLVLPKKKKKTTLTFKLAFEAGEGRVADALTAPAVAGVVALVVVPLKVGAPLGNFGTEKR